MNGYCKSRNYSRSKTIYQSLYHKYAEIHDRIILT
ncbi:hypothetical protein DWX11_14185 [Ruminococcus sp. AF18-29]|nr:hypothetical protein DWX11_14185 [Ruminococcus sp. AF18-29]